MSNPEVADVITTLVLHIPGFMGMRAACPHVFALPSGRGRCQRRDRVASLIVHLNDGHEWTREEIADWLDTLTFDLTISPTPVMDEADTWVMYECPNCAETTRLRTWVDMYFCLGCARPVSGPGRDR